MSYNGSGTFNINTTGQPVVAGTIISSAAFNALTADLATGLTTALTKDGQTTTTARILFAQGINSTLVTDASSTSTGSIFTAGGVGIAKKLYVGTDANIAGTLGVTGVATFSAAPIYSSLTASSAVATDASKALISVANTGTGSNVLATGPTIASANLTTALTLAGAAGTNGQVLTSSGSGLPTWATVSAVASVVRSPRTSNTILSASDQGNLIEATANSYTQTITAAATLGSGWWCYVSNAGTGFITIDPNASETITVNTIAQTTWILWPNEMGILVCNGSNFFYYVLHKGEITQTVSSAVASVSFATGLAYRRRMSLSVDNAGYATGSANIVRLEINSLPAGSSNFTGGFLRTQGSTFGGNSGTNMSLSGGFGPLATPTANDALFANIQINAGSAGVFASGISRLINASSGSVSTTTMGAWDDLTESTISTISIYQTTYNTVSGTFTLREL